MKKIILMAILLFNISLVHADLNDGLVAHFPFNGNVNDISVNGNDGTVHGATLTADRYGNPDNAYMFDGVNDYIEIPDSAELDLEEFTLSAWIKLDSLQAEISIVDHGEDISTDKSNYYLTLRNNQVRGGFEDVAGGPDNQNIYSSPSLEINKWYLLTVTRTLLNDGTDRSILNVYINDILENTSITRDNVISQVDSPLYIGVWYEPDIPSLVGFFPGIIDDVRIYNRPLTDSEVKALSLSGLSNQVLAYAAVEPGAGTQPVIENIWVLPDESLEEGTQIDLVPSGERDDIYACIIVSDAESRDTISDVFVDLYHPDRSFKYQVHANKLNMQETIECNDLALANGLITSAEHDDVYYNILSQPNWYMYKAFLPMYYHQPSGEYESLAYATDSTSLLSDAKSRSFEWVAGTYLELDFNTVEFGNIQPGAWKILNGDLDMGTPSAPTLKNEGNTKVKVGLKFSEFIGQDSLPNKVIDDFDAQLRNFGTDNYLEIPGEHLEFVADEEVWFAYPISLCRQEKIDFSIHADIGSVPDNYQGEIVVYAEPVIVSSPPPEFGEGLPNGASCTNDAECKIRSCVVNICGLGSGGSCISHDQCVNGFCTEFDLCG